MQYLEARLGVLHCWQRSQELGWFPLRHFLPDVSLELLCGHRDPKNPHATLRHHWPGLVEYFPLGSGNGSNTSGKQNVGFFRYSVMLPGETLSLTHVAAMATKAMPPDMSGGRLATISPIKEYNFAAATGGSARHRPSKGSPLGQ